MDEDDVHGSPIVNKQTTGIAKYNRIPFILFISYIIQNYDLHSAL